MLMKTLCPNKCEPSIEVIIKNGVLIGVWGRSMFFFVFFSFFFFFFGGGGGCQGGCERERRIKIIVKIKKKKNRGRGLGQGGCERRI